MCLYLHACMNQTTALLDTQHHTGACSSQQCVASGNTQEKERIKAEKDEVEKKYKTAKVDGRVEQVGWTACHAALRMCHQDMTLTREIVCPRTT